MLSTASRARRALRCRVRDSTCKRQKEISSVPTVQSLDLHERDSLLSYRVTRRETRLDYEMRFN